MKNARAVKLFEDALPRVERLLRMKSYRVSKIIPIEQKDLMQEALIATYLAVQQWDKDRGAKLEGFIAMFVDRRFSNIIERELAQKRMPEGWELEYEPGENELRWQRIQPGKEEYIDELGVDEGDWINNPVTPYEAMRIKEELVEFNLLRLKVFYELGGGVECSVFEEKVNPSPERILLHGTSNRAIGRYLGLTRHQVDRCIRKIKQKVFEIVGHWQSKS